MTVTDANAVIGRLLAAGFFQSYGIPKPSLERRMPGRDDVTVIIEPTENGIFLSIRRYIHDALTRYTILRLNDGAWSPWWTSDKQTPCDPAILAYADSLLPLLTADR